MPRSKLKDTDYEMQELEVARERMAAYATKQPNYFKVPYPAELDSVGSVLAGNPAKLAKRYGLNQDTSKENG